MSIHRFLIVTILLATALLAGGWFFRTQKMIAPVYSATLAGNTHIAVRFETGTAYDIATRISEEYRSVGWKELPASTRTFKLFSRNNQTAAFLAEDVSQCGTRLTEYHN